MSDHDEVRSPANSPLAGYPVIGETTIGFGEHLVRIEKLRSIESYGPIRKSAVEIVKRCRRFDGPDGQMTGLVVGYVQSGKTMSMTAVSSLARDNGCRIVILLAGVTTNLLLQNADRFQNDLRESSGTPSAWRIINSSAWGNRQKNAATDPDLQQLQAAIGEWRDKSMEESDRRTFLFMVLKHHAHLARLAKILESVDLKGIPALILDDEADQAGLNTKPGENEGSTTYERIRRVRAALPHHSYLQYTATPQAPLLIALDDMLSPAFAELIEPGEGYTGGLSFFGDKTPKQLIHKLVDDDLFSPGTPPDAPPDSLLDAMRVFFVGCAVSSFRKRGSIRSMLIHPSQRTGDQTTYLRWVNEITKRWNEDLRSSDKAIRSEIIADFQTAYDDLAVTDSELPPLDSLLKPLQLSLSRVQSKQINSEDGSELDWKNAEVHILVGGEKLNRGFTVEGLSVTYMPRSAGEWNADTIQQRARFFGYKQSYLSLCRVYLHPDVAKAFKSYVIHEEDIRKQLAAHRGKPLREWRRAFFLDSAMRPTKSSVYLDDYFKLSANQPWFTQRRPHGDGEAARHNLELVNRFEKALTFVSDEDYFSHSIADVPLKKVLDELLSTYDVRDSDRASWYGQIVTLGDLLDTKPKLKVRVVKMKRMKDSTEEKLGFRTPENDMITLHQGRSNKYPGDAKIFEEDGVTLQIHRLEVKGWPGEVTALAIHIPESLRKDDLGVLVQRA